MALPSFSRKILPVLAVVAIAAAAFFIFIGLPERSMQDPDKTPPEASKAHGGKGGVVASGVVEPSSEITDIGTNVSGVVSEVYVQIGQRVGRGVPLFAVDSRQVRATLREAEAGIAEAQAGITEARTNIATAQRQLALYRRVDDARAISQSEVIAAEGALNDARARLNAAQSQLAAAQARRASAATELARHIVNAPISGEVLDVEIRAGEFVSAGGQGGNAATPYIQMGETQPLHVRIDIDENEAGRIAQNANAVISPRGNAAKQVPVTFVRIEPQIVPKRSLTNSASERVDVRVMQIIYALPVGDTTFRVGQQVDAVIQSGDTKAAKP
jgi:multidrug efflux pump subunit AcrA (membrane-fusion protein)